MKLSTEEMQSIIDEIQDSDIFMQNGEFTTSDYAETKGITTHTAYNELHKALALGKVTKRQRGKKTPVYWKMAK